MALFLAALIPTLVYVAVLWWLDKYEKEPWGLFLAAFLYGCVPAVLFSILFELALSGGGVSDSVLLAPVVEELFKGAAVLMIFFLWRREFDGVLDGIVYGAVVGLGFAMVENLLYFLREEGDPSVILLRSFLFGLNHAFFTAFTGASLGLSRLSRRRSAWLLWFPLGVGAAITFHAIHNAAVQMGCLGLTMAALVDWGGVAVIVVVAVLSWRQERRWIEQELSEEVAGALLAEADFRALLSLRRRVGARLWMLRHHGWPAFRLLGRFFSTATELAFRKHHLREGTLRLRHPQELEELRQQLKRVRGALLSIMGGS